eukprot:GFYU01021709.1.p1 GENE.GFYU01021709.1~~GFYU01021709.1.p1  ORF type:complete len:165 (-),score=33.87 GFYU01021709.1:192-647(-)
MWCGYECSPQQSVMVNVTKRGPISKQSLKSEFSICTSFCQKLYESCGDVVWNGKKIRETFTSAEEFCPGQNTAISSIDIVLRDYNCFDYTEAVSTCHTGERSARLFHSSSNDGDDYNWVIILILSVAFVLLTAGVGFVHWYKKRYQYQTLA